MVKIIKQELEFVECLKQRLEFICEFSKVTPTFINGSIRKLEKTNLTYIEPHRVIIKNITFLVFNYSKDVYISNQDINVNEMGNYREIKKQLKQKEQKLEKANNQTKQIDNSSKDINTILDNLKPTLMNKNNMVISSEDVQKIIQKM